MLLITTHSVFFSEQQLNIVYLTLKCSNLFSEPLCFQILFMLTTGVVFLITTALMLRICVRYKHFLFELMNCIHFFILCRAFATCETGERIDSDREHIERKLLDEYKEKLVVDSKKKKMTSSCGQSYIWRILLDSMGKCWTKTI